MSIVGSIRLGEVLPSLACAEPIRLCPRSVRILRERNRGFSTSSLCAAVQLVRRLCRIRACTLNGVGADMPW